MFDDDFRPSVPPWLVLEFFGGYCPVQGWGSCDGHPWYFRSRGEHWTLTVSKPGGDPVAEGKPMALYDREVEYGEGPYDAGWMPHEEAWALILAGLGEFRAAQGLA